MTVQASIDVQYNSHRRNAMGDIFYGMDAELIKRLSPEVRTTSKKMQVWRSNSMMEESALCKSETLFPETEVQEYRSHRRNGLGDIFEGIDSELLKRLSPEMETFYKHDKTDVFTAENFTKKMTIKIRRSFSMVAENEMLKNYVLDNQERRNGVPDVTEKLEKCERNNLRKIYFSNLTSSHGVLCY